jgi:hypothetical protein
VPHSLPGTSSPAPRPHWLRFSNTDLVTHSYRHMTASGPFPLPRVTCPRVSLLSSTYSHSSVLHIVSSLEGLSDQFLKTEVLLSIHTHTHTHTHTHFFLSLLPFISLVPLPTPMLYWWSVYLICHLSFPRSKGGCCSFCCVSKAYTRCQYIVGTQ